MVSEVVISWSCIQTYGMIGVFLLSLLLGMLFIAMLQVAYRSRTILFALSLLILNNLFFMPRSSFSESFFNLFYNAILGNCSCDYIRSENAYKGKPVSTKQRRKKSCLNIIQ